MSADNGQSLQSGDVIARLLGVSKPELQKLVADGVIPKAGRDKYSLVTVVRAYINYVSGADSKPASQLEIAKHLSLSERRTREMLQSLNIDHKTTALSEVRAAYIQDIRDKAAGHVGDSGGNLIEERVLTERVDRKLKELQLAEKLGELVPADDVVPMIEQMVLAFRSHMLALSDALKGEIDAVYGIDVDASIISELIFQSLQRLSEFIFTEENNV